MSHNAIAVKNDSVNQGFFFDGKQVRVLGTPEEPLFVAKDVCECLDIQNVTQALGRLDDDEKGICSTYTLGGIQDVAVVTEPGLYSLILSSRKPEAKAFKHWIVHDVLTAIHKTGRYLDTQGHLYSGPLAPLQEAEKIISLVERTRALLTSLPGGLDSKDEFRLRDAADIVLRKIGSGKPANENKTEPKTVQELLYDRQSDESPIRIGKEMARLYRVKHGHDNPIHILQRINGRPTPVAAYLPEDWGLIDEVLAP